MIPLGPPWLVAQWVAEDDAIRLECLGCAWCASQLPDVEPGELYNLVAELRGDHLDCNPGDRPLRYLRDPSRYNSDVSD